MDICWWRKKVNDSADSAEQRLRGKYASFRELLSLNNECLELLSGLQEDLQFAPPTTDVIGGRIGAVFDRTASAVSTLERLTGKDYRSLAEAVRAQQHEVESYLAHRQELVIPKLSMWLSEVDLSSVEEVGGKAAWLGEIKNRLHLPVPEGYVLTAQAYRQFCGIPLWAHVRDLTKNVDLNDLDALRDISANLTSRVMASAIPRAIEIAISERAATVQRPGLGLAVRSSAVGEGGERTFAGQFLSLINVPPEQVIDAYKQVVAARFSERALFYRLSAGLAEVQTPIAVLCLRVIPARASGIMYTRDPNGTRNEALWITATHGLGIDIASGAAPADLFVVARSHPHRLLDQTLTVKDHKVVLRNEGGLIRIDVDAQAAAEPSLTTDELRTLAAWGMTIEKHFGTAQDIEWAQDENGDIYILQSRPLVVADSPSFRTKSRVRQNPLLTGGHTVFPGRVSGTAHLVSEPRALSTTPQGAILFLRKASPEIVEVFPRIAGLVAEWGNLAGHAAALLREFKIPSVFQLSGAFDQLQNGQAVSLDAVQPRIYAGTLWPQEEHESPVSDRSRPATADPIQRRMLVLNLLDPASFNFRPAGCKSAHDVLRFCHEKAIETMFAVNDELERGVQTPKRLLADVPVNLYVLDLGRGLSLSAVSAAEVKPDEITSRPFQALWRGISHPDVTWTRAMPASISDLASVMATSLTAPTGATRALGERSYLLVADEYMNLNSRLAYHFTLVDACLSDIPGNNYISFRFAGGGAPRERRNLRAGFIEACLSHYGFLVDRRGDLVNAWFKKAPADKTAESLDLLGRLMACTSQLDMYMTSDAVKNWYVQQFLQGNYSFRQEENKKVSTSI